MLANPPVCGVRKFRRCGRLAQYAALQASVVQPTDPSAVSERFGGLVSESNSGDTDLWSESFGDAAASKASASTPTRLRCQQDSASLASHPQSANRQALSDLLGCDAVKEPICGVRKFRRCGRLNQYAAMKALATTPAEPSAVSERFGGMAIPSIITTRKMR